MRRFILLVGLPGAGKSTLIKKHIFPFMHLDDELTLTGPTGPFKIGCHQTADKSLYLVGDYSGEVGANTGYDQALWLKRRGDFNSRNLLDIMELTDPAKIVVLDSCGVYHKGGVEAIQQLATKYRVEIYRLPDPTLAQMKRVLSDRGEIWGDEDVRRMYERHKKGLASLRHIGVPYRDIDRNFDLGVVVGRYLGMSYHQIMSELGRYDGNYYGSGGTGYEYESYRRANEAVARRMKDTLDELGGVPPATTVIDYGAALGWYLDAFRQAGFGTTIGVDTSDFAREEMTKSHHVTMRTIEEYLDQLTEAPTSTHTSDTIIFSSACIQHLVMEDIEEVHRTFYKILSEGTKLGVLYHRLPLKGRYKPASPYVELHDLEGWIEIVCRAGFKVHKIVKRSHYAEVAFTV